MPTSWAAPAIPPYPLRSGRGQARARRRGLACRDPAASAAATACRSRSTFRPPSPSRPTCKPKCVMQQELRAAGIDLHDQATIRRACSFAQDGPLYGGRYDLSLTIDTNAPDPDNEGEWSGAFIPPHGANTTFLNDPVITATSHLAARTFDRATPQGALRARGSAHPRAGPGGVPVLADRLRRVQQRPQHYRAAQYLSSNWNAWQWCFRLC